MSDAARIKFFTTNGKRIFGQARADFSLDFKNREELEPVKNHIKLSALCEWKLPHTNKSIAHQKL